jgi:hypothetical protein
VHIAFGIEVTSNGKLFADELITAADTVMTLPRRTGAPKKTM